VIPDRLKQVIFRELDLEEFELEESTTAAMVPGWDSLSHIRVIAAVEEEYGIRFKPLEIIRLLNVGQLQELIDRKRIQSP